MRIFLTLILFFALNSRGMAQQKWNLQTIVEYAMANNINVKLSDVQARVAAINYQQNKAAQYPNLSFGANESFNAGNNQNPNDFSRTTQTYLSTGLQLQTSADIFNFYSKRNIIAASNWELQAATAATDKAKNDIALTAANAYLQILLSKAQENITAVQIGQTTAQLSNTRKQVDAGALPELNATQLEAQLALDSLNYLTAKGNTDLAMLTLKSYMNIDAAAPFDIDLPPVDKIPVEPIASLQPDYVYALALKNQPQQRYDDFKIKAAEKNVSASKGAMYPTLSGFGNLGSSYVASKTPALAPVFGDFAPTAAVVNVNNTPYTVYTPKVTYVQNGYSRTGPFFPQLSDNFKQAVGLSINVPIFNGRSLRSNYERSKLNVTTLQLQKEQDDQKLKNDIYQAYTSALIAYQKFNTAKKTVDVNELNLSYAQKRADVGMLGTFDLITTQNNLLRAKLEYVQNRFDYVFKMKVLEFYKGSGLKL